VTLDRSFKVTRLAYITGACVNAAFAACDALKTLAAQNIEVVACYALALPVCQNSVSAAFVTLVIACARAAQKIALLTTVHRHKLIRKARSTSPHFPCFIEVLPDSALFLGALAICIQGRGSIAFLANSSVGTDQAVA
jgi:hypothetical protein